MVLETPESLPTDARFVYLMRVPTTTTWLAATSHWLPTIPHPTFAYANLHVSGPIWCVSRT